jgi:uronate dehydrogenase
MKGVGFRHQKDPPARLRRPRGIALLNGLRQLGKYEVIGTSRRPNEEHGITSLDVRDPEACKEAFRGVDVVVHCASYMTDKFRHNFVEQQIPSNLIGGFNVYEAAHACGVKRVVYCSSIHAVGFYKIGDKIDEFSPMRPDSGYGMIKCFMEVMGRYYSDRFGISSINLRIGHLNAEDKPWSRRTADIFLSHRDCVQIVERSIDADPELKFATLFATSNNTDKPWDLSLSEKLIGYHPQDNGSELIDPEKLSHMEDSSVYLGGLFPMEIQH